jgi:hypothetical protein
MINKTLMTHILKKILYLLSLCPWLLSSRSDSSILFRSIEIDLEILFCSSSSIKIDEELISTSKELVMGCWLFCSFESRCCRNVFIWLVRRGRCWNNVLALLESLRSMTRSNLIHSSWLNERIFYY